MTRERAKELAPIIQAYAEGKEIEYRAIGYEMWNVVLEPLFGHGFEYRIKSEPKKRLMTSGEVLYMVTTTPAMVYRYQRGPAYQAPLLDSGRIDFDYEWAIIDKSGEPIDGWHKFETEDATA
jgi:hypothetical protein